MKVIMYGSRICSDCLWAEGKIKERSDIELEYRQITKDVPTLKEFLAYRDHDPVFDQVRELGLVGIPFYILEDGTKTLNTKEVLNNSK